MVETTATEVDAGERLARISVWIVMWMYVWGAILLIAAPRGNKRTRLVVMNACHGVIAPIVAITTLMKGANPTVSIAASIGYFAVDLMAMADMDGFDNLRKLHRSRYMDYVHHVLGIVWGIMLFLQEGSVCTSAIGGNPYVWIQTNEVSTPFYTWFRLTNNPIGGVLFALTFFLSRVVFNTGVLMPRILQACKPSILWGCVPFLLLQYVWFVMILRRLLRALRPQSTAEVAAKDKAE